jgi:hypothetical protein
MYCGGSYCTRARTVSGTERAIQPSRKQCARWTGGRLARYRNEVSDKKFQGMSEASGPTICQCIYMYKVHVLAVPYTAAPQIYLYTASISTEFLDKFDQPSKVSPSKAITINYYNLRLRKPTRLPLNLFLALHAPLD